MLCTCIVSIMRNKMLYIYVCIYLYTIYNVWENHEKGLFSPDTKSKLI